MATIPSHLIQILRRKVHLRDRGDPAHEAIRPVLVVLGGAMRGVAGSAIATVFHDLGLARAFEAVVGLSAGAATAAYFAAGSRAARYGVSIFYNSLPPDFFRFSRYPWMNLPKLERAFREGATALPPVAQWELSMPVWVGAVRRDGKEIVWFQLQKMKDPVSYILASCAVPVFWPGGVSLPEGVFSDGELLFSGALPRFVAALQPTDVVIIANDPPVSYGRRGVWKRMVGVVERGAFRFVRFALPVPPSDKEILLLWLQFANVYTREVIERIGRAVPRTHVLWSPPVRVGRTTQDPERLFAYACLAHKRACRALGVPVFDPVPLVPLRE